MSTLYEGSYRQFDYKAHINQIFTHIQYSCLMLILKLGTGWKGDNINLTCDCEARLKLNWCELLA